MEKEHKQLGMLKLPDDKRVDLSRIESYRLFKRSNVEIRTFSGDRVDLWFDSPDERDKFVEYLDGLFDVQLSLFDDIISE